MNTAHPETATIAKNTSFLTIASALQKAISFTYFIYYARQIGPAETGTYGFAISFVTIFGILVDFGISPVLIREVARARERAQELLSAVLAIKCVTGLVAFSVIAVVLSLLNVPAEAARLVYIVAVAMIVESLTLTVYGVFRGFQNLTYEAIGVILYQIIVFATGALGLAFFHSTFMLGVAFLLGALGNLFFGAFQLWRVLRIAFKIRYLPQTVDFFRRHIAPFFIAGIFGRGNANVDNLLLERLRGVHAVGLYSPAYKIFFALHVIPSAFNSTIYPAFSALYLRSKEALSQTFERAIIYLAAVSIPLTVGIVVLAGEILHFFLPSFSEAVPALQIISIGLLFLFINFVLSSLLNAGNLEWRNTQNAGIVLGISIVLNLLLIPRFGHVGAALSSTASVFLLTLLGWFWARRIVSVSRRLLIGSLAKIMGCAAVMGLIVFLLKPYLSVIVLILFAVIVYTALILMTRLFSVQDVRAFFRSLRRREAPTP